MRCLTSEQPDRAVACINRQYVIKYDVRKSNNDRIAALIFSADAFVQREELRSAVFFQFLLELSKIAVCQSVCDTNAVHSVHSECVIPMPMGQDGNFRQW